MDCRISGSSMCKKTVDVLFFSNCVPSEYIPHLNICAYLGILPSVSYQSAGGLSFTYDGRDICLSFFAPCRNARPKEMLNMFSFFFSSMRTDFLFGESFQAFVDSSCSYSCSHSQLFHALFTAKLAKCTDALNSARLN